MFFQSSTKKSEKISFGQSNTVGVDESEVGLSLLKYMNVQTPLQDNNGISSICYHLYCRFEYHLGKEPTKNSEVVVECLPPSTYKDIAPLLGLDPDKQPAPGGAYHCKLQQYKDLDLVDVNKQVEECLTETHLALGVRSDVSSDLLVNPGTYRDSVNKDPPPANKKDNPYLRFMKKLDSKSKLADAKVTLARRSGEITNSIIKDFIAWFKELGGGPEETCIDEAIMHELFQIGFDMPASKALAVRIKEMPAIPQSLADIQDETNQSMRACLRRFLIDDAVTEQFEPRTIGFGKTLPRRKPHLYFKPPNNNVKKTWLECQSIPAQVDSMETVFRGIEDLRSTLAFCDWLKQHPEVPPPRYLVEKGIMDLDYKHLLEDNAEFAKTKMPGSKRTSILRGKLVLPNIKLDRDRDNSEKEKHFIRECRR